MRGWWSARSTAGRAPASGSSSRSANPSRWRSAHVSAQRAPIGHGWRLIMAKSIPEGLHSVTPHLTVEGCAEAIETWKKAFGAEEVFRAPDPTGKKIWHAEVRIGDSVFFANDYSPEVKPDVPPHAHPSLYLGDVHKAFQRATHAA